MNPYPERMAELHHWLETRFGQRDREATEVLLAALLSENLTGYRRPWFVIETDWPSRDTVNAWFSFGGLARVHTLAVARVLRASPRETLVSEWLKVRDEGGVALYVDSEWRRLHYMMIDKHDKRTGYASYHTLLAQTLRLRVEHPKTAWSAKPISEQKYDLTELTRLAMRVLDVQHRTKKMPVYDPPKSLYYWVELVQKLSPWMTDWEAAIKNIAGTVRGICTLYNDPERKPDWGTAERLLRDSINYCVWWILEQAANGQGVKRWDTWVGEGYTLQKKWNAELRRLSMEHVIQRLIRPDGKRNHYKLLDDDWRILTTRSEKLFT